ncbi:hypothetical protein AMATHDRAFT_69276 [Amanita thiersii Skay4041]|uniref:DUF3533 domain-containing protein n=1 Tax=Amanita thiersii Skay4041 TaxID=703135 RepID=A0A2A9NG60_9AGAR|nr:hypothetical protein AMATHDRAFT_69276 [Amanita thiersii Skay4041]
MPTFDVDDTSYHDNGHDTKNAPLTGHKSAPYSKTFWDKEMATARQSFLRIMIGGTVTTILAIFAIFPIYWGALWKIPDRNLPGWVVDFDGGFVGGNVTRALVAGSPMSKVTWAQVPASDFPGGISQLAAAIREERAWVAVSINEGATSGLMAALSNPNPTYDGSTAITSWAAEARNENAFRALIRPSVTQGLEFIVEQIAFDLAKQVATTNLTAILTAAPQTLIRPVSYKLRNLEPFDMPVASAVTFVGLLYLLILTFFIVMIGNGAREFSGMDRMLTTSSFIQLRLFAPVVAYFILSLFYSLLSLAFKVNFGRKFGPGGFVLFWILNWVGMLSVGLALEAMFTLLTARFIAFFMLLWIIANVAVCIFPIEVMPSFYRYGYGSPFYNMSRAIRTILFDTKNKVGMNFGVLIAWTVISCISLPLIQFLMRRREMKQTRHESLEDVASQHTMHQ